MAGALFDLQWVVAANRAPGDSGRAQVVKRERLTGCVALAGGLVLEELCTRDASQTDRSEVDVRGGDSSRSSIRGRLLRRLGDRGRSTPRMCGAIRARCRRTTSARSTRQAQKPSPMNWKPTCFGAAVNCA
jgi:hypothetical protein